MEIFDCIKIKDFYLTKAAIEKYMEGRSEGDMQYQNKVWDVYISRIYKKFF